VGGGACKALDSNILQNFKSMTSKETEGKFLLFFTSTFVAANNAEPFIMKSHDTSNLAAKLI